MPKPTHASITEESCKCGCLERAANDPHSYIVFDPKVNEYHFRYPCPYEGNPTAMGSLMIYHCFFCGGAAPPSKRHELFTVVTSEERDRVAAMFDGLRSEEEMVKALGPPDQVFPRRERRAGTYCSMKYTRLSETVMVHITVRPTLLDISLSGKYIGPTVTESDS